MYDLFANSINFINNILWSYILIGLLLGAGVYFTIRMKFGQMRYFREMIRVLAEKPSFDKKDKNQISSLQAFMIGAATRIGTGNVAGVATAIAAGGPGAVFWMWLVAVLGGATAFVESTLAQIYKVKDEVGYRGGPAYYIQKQIGSKWMSRAFAIGIIVSFGLVFNSVQSNTIAEAFTGSFSINPMVIAIVLTVLTGVIIFGGVARIARFSEKVVPVMAVFYMVLALYVTFSNFTEIPAMLLLIFKSAFGFEEVVGGGMGAAISMGVKRGLFSNEAGMGSAPNAAATAEVSHPVKQGFIQAMGVFFDTLLVCTATASIILLSGKQGSAELTGVNLTQAAMGEHFGSWAGGFLAIAILTFAFSSIVGSYYYGEANIGFVSKRKASLYVYRIAALGMVAFGALASLQLVWSLADLAMALMAFINLVAILIIGKYAFAALRDYMEQRKQGKDPVFYAHKIEGLKGVECWQEDQEVGEQMGANKREVS
ncbi:sodium:alanine symporter family protein [Mechercharimyces sp. CAU 1602]|uniref:alanine/glycine:cation symporter family protein n=1 Tax=Mechercharimyces sp. CAU 1602 TaxID=2973933 RepID=UPI002162DAC1|nr:alanine/glycine:cation symporter family protein [Mechercharimyces sp. CAU 1602]MCS1351958.1 alanine:cation symporter family protein [Mechercharimyces sp. CAU 1602]